MLEYQKMINENKNCSPNDCPVLSFMLAKNILAFKEEGRDARFAYYLLENLADRVNTQKTEMEYHF